VEKVIKILSAHLKESAPFMVNHYLVLELSSIAFSHATSAQPFPSSSNFIDLLC
jgi:hypothetical protein